MVNSNSKPPAASNLGGSPPAQQAGGSVPAQSSGNGSNPAGNGGGGGAPSGGSVPGVIPGSGTKARFGLRTEVTVVATGIGTQIPDGSQLTVKGVPVPKSQLLAQFAAALAHFAAIDTDVQAVKHDRLALAAATPGIRLLLSDVKAALVAHFGKGNPALVAFGFSGKKPRQLTSKQKVAKEVKVAGTRELRGTTGPASEERREVPGEGPRSRPACLAPRPPPPVETAALRATRPRA